MLIKVFGPGCAKCKETELNVLSAVQEANNGATVEKVTDLQAMIALGIMSTPAVVIDGRVMCTGHVPSKQEVMGWFSSTEQASGNVSCSCGCGCVERAD